MMYYFIAFSFGHTSCWQPSISFVIDDLRRKIPKNGYPCMLLDSALYSIVTGVICSHFLLGGARSKGFATLRNVSKLTFLGQDWARKTGGHFACACVNPLKDNSVGASNLMAGNRKLAREVTVRVKAISLVL